ncbi:MAG TPA: glycine zipper family protein [Candidatus Margulisiibacteriota bacterium]|nr:glycine zipper family protein [Candidatus Margulisiibacteriota bacterium]
MSLAQRSHLGILLVSSLMLVVAGCAARRPVLYPNEQLNKVGDAAAQRDIDDCMQRADQYVKSGGQSAQVAKQVGGRTVVAGGVGAATGAVGGAIAGNPGEGAAIGAASGATAGLLSGLFDSWSSKEVDPVYANFVDRCLRERGYEPIGWK